MQTNEDRVDQVLCRILAHNRWRGLGESAVGDTIDLRLDVAEPPRHEITVTEGVVEKRHLEAVEAFIKNYPIRSLAGVTFRVEPR
jgi:hypothetical protein